MDKITGKSLYEKTCPPGRMSVVTGEMNPNWDGLSEGFKKTWEEIAEQMEKIRAEEEL